MNIIISKLDFPCDIKFQLNNFCYDKLGYTSDELDYIYKIKIKNFIKKIYIKLELLCWKNSGLSITWLKPTISGKCGYFSSIFHIKNSLIDAYKNNWISENDFSLLSNDLGDIMFSFY